MSYISLYHSHTDPCHVVGKTHTIVSSSFAITPSLQNESIRMQTTYLIEHETLYEAIFFGGGG